MMLVDHAAVIAFTGSLNKRTSELRKARRMLKTTCVTTTVATIPRMMDLIVGIAVWSMSAIRAAK